MADPDHHRDKRQRVGDGMDLDGPMQPTNHERQPMAPTQEGAASNMEDTALQASTSDPDLDELEKDMGEPFLLCRSSKAL